MRSRAFKLLMDPAQHTAPWWSRMSRWTQTSLKEAATAEGGLLSLVTRPGRLFTADVVVGKGPQEWLHTISNVRLPAAGTKAGAQSAEITTQAPEPAAAGAPPVVLMPGYGAGAGFFFRNFSQLSSAVRLYAVDWLGTGLSGRPKFTANGREQTEAFFLDSLAEWRQQAGIGNERMVLVGHSLGGYLAASYALAHPEHVEHLVLVCPAGVPKAPEDWHDKFIKARTGFSGTLFRTAMKLWEAGYTPHSLVRAAGPWGPRICENYVVRRFVHHGDGLSPSEIHWFKEYFYHSIAQQGSGEYALRHLLAPGAWAHEPLVERLKELKVPVTMIYGSHDWMRPEHGVEMCRQLKELRPPKVDSDLHVEIIEDAGHFVFIDQPTQFNQALLSAISRYLPRETLDKLQQPSSQSADSTSWGEPAASTTTY